MLIHRLPVRGGHRAQIIALCAVVFLEYQRRQAAVRI
jgi:hypothetical protein